MSISRAIRSRIEAKLPPKVANFWCHVTEGAVGSFGSGMVGREVFPVMVTALGGSALALGLLGTIQSIRFLPQLIFAPAIEAVRRKKLLVLALGLGQRLQMLVVVGFLVVLGLRNPIACLWGIAGARFIAVFLESLSTPAWTDLIAETVPHERLSRLAGFRDFFASLTKMGAAPVCALVIAAVALPHNYALLYLLAFAAAMGSWALFSLVDEIPKSVAPKARLNHASYFRKLIPALRNDGNYRNFLFYMAVEKGFDEVVMFYSAAAITLHNMPKYYVAPVALAAVGGASMICNLLLPFVAEKVGVKRLLSASLVLRAAAALVAALAPGWWWFVAVFAMGGAGLAARNVAGIPLMMRVYPSGKRIGYIALGSVVIAPARMLSPLAAGLLVNYVFGYRWFFALVALILVAALLPLSRCNPTPLPEGDGEGPA